MKKDLLFVGFLFIVLIGILIFAPKQKIQIEKKIYERSWEKTISERNPDEILSLFEKHGFEMPQHIIESYGLYSEKFVKDAIRECFPCLVSENFQSFPPIYTKRKDYFIHSWSIRDLQKEMIRVYKLIPDKLKR